MTDSALNKEGAVRLLMGNEAVARGAVEADIGVAAAYPGSPSSEVLPAITAVAQERNIHVEWSVNEKVATEVAAAASLAGIRSFSVMKQNGANVACDFLVNLNTAGIGDAGMVLYVADDPSQMTSTNEQDSRPLAKWMASPLLEPSNAQEAKDMVKWAYELSEELNLFVFVRGVTRLSYTKGNTVLGTIEKKKTNDAYFPDLWDMQNPKRSKFVAGPFPVFRKPLFEKIERAREIFETSRFNQYTGPKTPELLIVTSGVCTSYAKEAVQELGVDTRVGILRLGTVWPLPEKLVAQHLATTKKVLFIEETEPFIEESVMEFASSLLPDTCDLTFYGNRSKHLKPYDEQCTNLIIDALEDILQVPYKSRDASYEKKVNDVIGMIPDRPINMCAGCPHRATFWAVKTALQLDGRHGFVAGDIGCYAMAAFGAAGYFQSRSTEAMGSGAGLASGFGQLDRHGFTQPVLAVSGDSTFYHGAIPALINGAYNNSNFLLLVLDNSATAMTGFQPHAGTGKLATGEPATVVDIEAICKAVGARVEVYDPFELDTTIEALLRMIKEDGVRVIIMRHMCQLVRNKMKIPPQYKMHIDPEKCLWDKCGCDRLCTRIFGCPGLMWDSQTGKAAIDEALCVGCGLCADICPANAIIREEITE